ncbi:MAG: AtpZ/AtpI family protein [Bdellovibrionales bacterium]
MISQKEKLDDLSRRIRKVEADMNPAPKAEKNPLREAGYDFAGVLVGSVILGVLLDRFFETSPWCVIGMVVLGFVTGIMGVRRVLQKPEGKE